MRVTELTPNRSFSVEAGFPGFNMSFDHELIADGTTTRAVHRVSFSGALNFILGRLVGGVPSGLIHHEYGVRAGRSAA